MNLGIICDITNNEMQGVIAINKDTKEVAFATNNNELENIINIILDHSSLELIVNENLNGCEILRNEEIDISNPNYLIAFNYHLPFPWRVLGIRYVEGDLSQIIEESFQYIENIRED